MVTLCILMALIAFGNAMVDYFFFDNHLLQLGFCLSGATLVSILSFIWLPRQMACCNFYMFISSVLYVSLSGAQVTCPLNGGSFLATINFERLGRPCLLE